MKRSKIGFILVSLIIFVVALTDSGYAILGLGDDRIKNVKKGQKEFIKKKFDKAVEHFAKNKDCEDCKPDNKDYPILMINLATGLWGQGNYAEALEAFDNASIQIFGRKEGWLGLDWNKLWNDLTELNLTIKDPSSAKWIGAENERLFLRFYSGLCYFMARNYEEAIVEFRRCNDFSSQYPIVHYFYGIALREIDDVNAKVAFNTADTLWSKAGWNNPMAKLELMHLKYKDREEEEAHAYYEKIKDVLSDNPCISDSAVLENTFKNGTNLCLLIEKGLKSEWKDDGSIRVKIGDKYYGQPYLLDTSFKRGSFLKDLAKALIKNLGEYAKKQAEEAILRRIPGGKTAKGIWDKIKGKRDRSIVTWSLLPWLFWVYETYLPPGEYAVTVEYLNKKGKVKESVKKNIKVDEKMTIVPINL